MSIRLSTEQIESFCGNVLPLKLLGDCDLTHEPIRWSCDGDAVMLRTFDQETDHPFSDGVLLTLMKPGEACVKAELGEECVSCRVSIRPMKKAVPGEPLSFYIGDFHDHTSEEHNHDRFAARTDGFPIDCIRQIRDENKLDFHVLSDHAVTTNPSYFFRGFTDEQAAQPMDLVVFPGTESEVTAREYDRYGIQHKNSGEIVTVNAASFSWAQSWEEFYEAMAGSPFAVCALAHPQVVGWSVPGIWNFKLHKNNTPQLKRMVKMIEMGNGSDRESNLINEYTYSYALDNGFRVSTTCSSDSHGPRWGYDVFPGKTIIMAPEKSREAFLDAMQNNRIYACDSGNLKVQYTVNGTPAPADLALANQYDFHLEIGCFHEDSSTLPVKCQVVSDYGQPLLTLEGEPFTELDFTVNSDSARYFYLRLTDSEGRRTWTPPVYTGREYDAPANDDDIEPIAKALMTAKDELTGEDASVLLNDDPKALFTAPAGRASILIDMQKVLSVAGVSHYPYSVTHQADKHLTVAQKVCKFPSEYRISVSTDGETFAECARGVFRVFGGEEIIRFAERNARFVRVEIFSTVGRASDLKDYAGAALSIAELTVYTHK